jgi:two-component system cell cycle sensor histidine kinase/response regulator CckA
VSVAETNAPETIALPTSAPQTNTLPTNAVGLPSAAKGGKGAPSGPQADPEQERRLRIVGQLAGGIAHDFNNLLTAILGAADAILDRAETTPETAADLRQIRRGVERGAALIRQLLAFSRQQTLQPRVVAVNAAIEDVVPLLRRLLGEKVTVVLALEQPGRRVWADPGQLDQVLLNLAVNARDAMAEGGTLTLSSGHVTLYGPRIVGTESVPAGRYVTITVADTGGGIPDEVMPRIFEPFFTTKRAQEGTHRGGTNIGGTNIGGTGLGLSTVLGIVRQSGGFLEVASQAGIGTRVVVHLPRHDAAEADAVPTPRVMPRSAVGGEGRIVLVVEDEEPVRRVLARALTRAGWRALTAETAEAALEMVGRLDGSPESQLSVVISDVVMPGMDGPALVRAVREIFPGVPAALVSGYAEPALRQGLDAADIAFLAKPYATAELLDLVARLAAGKG